MPKHVLHSFHGLDQGSRMSAEPLNMLEANVKALEKQGEFW